MNLRTCRSQEQKKQNKTKQKRKRKVMPQNESCIEACNECVTACENCASSCLHEQDIKPMARCIELDRDCADICSLAAQFMSRAGCSCRSAWRSLLNMSPGSSWGCSYFRRSA